MKRRSLLFFVLLIFFHHGLQAQAYDVKSFSANAYQKSVKRAGKVAFKKVSNLSFKSNGYLKKLTVDEGDFFSQSQLLASLNTVELNADKNARYAELLQAKREVARIKSLMENKLSSQQALDAAQTRVETTRAAYKVAYYNLEKSEVIAPFDGVVLSKKTELGEYQTPGHAVFEVAATHNNLIVRVGLTGNEISYVKAGQRVQVHMAKLGLISGVISKVPVKTSIDSQMYLIEVLLDSIEAGKGVVAGLLAQVIFNFATDTDVYQIPIRALNEINSEGLAVLLIKTSQGKLVHQTFNVFNIDSQYLYLDASNNHNDIEVVVNGWQHTAYSDN